MSHSTSLPTKAIDAGWLKEPVEILKQNTNRHYRVFSRNSKVYEAEYEVDSDGKQVFSHTEELAYVVGTGANGATPMVRRGNYLFQAPISYYAAKKSWDLSPNYEMRDLGFTLPVSADCIACHAGRTQPVKGREGLYEDPPILELGISCERCHGPGELHVKERMAGVPTHGKRDTSIVNPAKLPTWLADNICMNCHEGDNRTLQPGKSASDFRPGIPLNETAVILKTPVDPNNAQSPLLEHYYSMSLSRCYRQSKGKLGCQSCHDPHVQPRADETVAYFRARCVRCHTETDCSIALKVRQNQTPPDACINCHMPKEPVLTVSHSTLTNHRIIWTSLCRTWLLKQRFPARGISTSIAVPGTQRRVPVVVLLQAYRRELIGLHLQFKEYYFGLSKRLSRRSTNNPLILSALAQKAFSDGDVSKAVAYASQVVNQGSTSANDYLLLDQVLAQSGDLPGAIRALQKGLLIAPYNNFLYQRLAVRQFSFGDSYGALQTIRQGLELNPEDTDLRDMREEALREGLVH